MTDATLRDYQVADLSYYLRDKRCMNLSDPATGKTPSVCVMEWVLWKDFGVGTAFVMPNRLRKKNRDEVLRFTGFSPEDVVILDGPPKKIAKQLQSGAKVFIMGFTRWALSWRKLPAYVKAVHVDEFHMGFKSINSRRTQELVEAFRIHMEWFIAMSGTLVDGRLDSAYPAIHIIEPRYYPSHEGFMWQHAVKDFDGNVIGWKNHAKMSAIFGRHGIRRTFESIYGAESKVLIPELVEMSPRQRVMYDKFKDEAVLELEKFFVDGTVPGVSFIRARQIMEHPNEFPDLMNPGKFIDIMPGEIPGKEERLAIHIEYFVRSGKPVVIFSAMLPQQRRIAALAAAIGLQIAVLNGNTSPNEGYRIDEDFRAGKLQGLLVSPACASVGFNWQFWGEEEVEDMILVAGDFKDTSFFQAYRRMIRGTRKRPLRIRTLEYEDSLDQHIFGIYRRKSEMAHLVDPPWLTPSSSSASAPRP